MAKRTRESSLSTQDPPLEDISSTSIEVAHTPKYVELEHNEEQVTSSFKCLLPPHKPMTFATYAHYETHYNTSHANRCKDCRKNFPSSHFLQLHLSENHDPIVAVKRERGDKTYVCFLEDCEKVCIDWKKRRSHLVDKHGYPKNYDFLVIDNGTDGKWTMLRRGVDADGHRKSSRERRGSSATQATQTTEASSVSQRTEQSEPEEVSREISLKARTSPAKDDAALESITRSMSSLQFVPRSITFGKRKGKSGFAKS
ncbi:Putative Zinc finger protein [Septoria linicola]|uniref:Zinc finger protein n=1 Tax=Septoria linicola TaxID=215465 RepID=A0A9Q9AIH0_9PEZI|nr:putative Zinc finger protein [Septoria linicola]USW49882.1 Putative Zinc finger protein [Septoria linicola]